ncbi:Formamidopyrimidine-DNA glycosylase [Bienertia sinuspersici]
MDKGNKGWWEFPRWSDVYEQGTDEYIEKAFATRCQGNQISCPCCTCHYRYWYDRNDVRDHIICNGFVPRNDESFHLRRMSPEREAEDLQHDEPSNVNDGIEELLYNALREGPNEEAKKFLNLIEEGQQELYSGCKKMSRLAFTIRLYIYKCDYKLPDVAIAGLLEFFKEVLPDDAMLPTSMHEAKKVLKLLGLDYKKIDACPIDCMLYWAEHANATSCHVCGTSRWKSKESDQNDNSNEKPRRIPSKVLRYFPIKKRLQRLYMCAETASYMTWHKYGRENDGLLRHPADGQAWINFDKKYPSFSNEPRNVRLALATDGFNPFQTMSIVHSTWLVILVNYNLPPWLATKSEFLMLSLLIPGPLSPGNSIDVYLQPLMKDVDDLWQFGLETYDASTNTRFDMHVALLSTISDFPGYAMLSGWSTKGKFACPCCHYEVDSVYLKYSHKFCYMSHRKWLDSDHPWRYNKRSFNGHIETRNEPVRLTGGEIEQLLHDFPNEFGKEQPKMRQDADDPNPWRKFSIFFKLPYWKHCDLRHNLDVMHIEKNMFDNVIGTLLAIPGKTKDNVAARRDLKNLREEKGLRWVPELEGKQLEDGSEEFPTSMFLMNDDEKQLFCQTIKNAKLPQGYASNISRCVQVGDRKITGYKSHDAHFMMHYLLPIDAKETLSRHVATPIIRMSNFFKGIWKKAIDPQDLDNLQSEIVETLCQFEGIFPPAFFDIMVHLPVHLVEEIKLGGPVAIRCMYAIERYLRELKSDARNKGRPEASMAEGFLAKECARFVARHLSKSKGPSKGPSVHPNQTSTPQKFLPKLGHPIKGRGKTSKKKQVGTMIDHTTWSQAHQYVLFNCDCEEVERYIK